MKYGNLAKLWILADRVLVPRLQNEIIDMLLSSTSIEPGSFIELFDQSSSLSSFYENTLEGSPLRRVLVRDLAKRTVARPQQHGPAIAIIPYTNIPRNMLIDTLEELRTNSWDIVYLENRRYFEFHVSEDIFEPNP